MAAINHFQEALQQGEWDRTDAREALSVATASTSHGAPAPTETTIASPSVSGNTGCPVLRVEGCSKGTQASSPDVYHLSFSGAAGPLSSKSFPCWGPRWDFGICGKKKKSDFRTEDNISKSGFK